MYKVKQYQCKSIFLFFIAFRRNCWSFGSVSDTFQWHHRRRGYYWNFSLLRCIAYLTVTKINLTWLWAEFSLGFWTYLQGSLSSLSHRESQSRFRLPCELSFFIVFYCYCFYNIWTSQSVRFHNITFSSVLWFYSTYRRGIKIILK